MLRLLPVTDSASLSFTFRTALQPGAIAIVQLGGESADLDGILAELTGRTSIPLRVPTLAPFADIDEGLVVRLSDTSVFLMPHGGPRILQRLGEFLGGQGVLPQGDDDPGITFPEASDLVEARMLDVLTRAASPLAIDLLLDQPRRWREQGELPLMQEDLDRSQRLNRLLTPPVVVVAGPPNVGKSTLANALLGRTMSIALDQPGSTRDYTRGTINLAGLVVHWHDTPGIPGIPSRVDTALHSPPLDTSIESQAIALAEKLIAQADYLIFLTDPHHSWPALPVCSVPHLRVLNKVDLPGAGAEPVAADLSISATTGEGISQLVRRIRDDLISPGDLNHAGPWKFWN